MTAGTPSPPAILEAPRRSMARRRLREGDLPFRLLALVVTAATLAVIALMMFDSVQTAWPVFRQFGIIGFLTGQEWSPAFTVYGAWPFLYGTLVTSAIALTIAVPISILIALMVTEVLPPRLSQPVAIVVDLLAAVPSVVWGLWGLLVLLPFIRPFEHEVASGLGQVIPFLGGPTPGPSYFAAGLIVAMMIIPIVAAVTREVFAATPRLQREAVQALGGTRWDVVQRVVLPLGRTGIVAAVLLGLGRAIGETIAVTMVVGNNPLVGGSIFSPGYTLASVIANEFNEATETLHPEALIALGVVLLALAIAVNGAGLMVRRRFERSAGRGR